MLGLEYKCPFTLFVVWAQHSCSLGILKLCHLAHEWSESLNWLMNTDKHYDLIPGSTDLFLARASPSAPRIIPPSPNRHRISFFAHWGLTLPWILWLKFPVGAVNIPVFCDNCEPASVCWWQPLCGFLTAPPSPSTHIHFPNTRAPRDVFLQGDPCTYLS